MPNYPYSFQLPPLNVQDIPNNGAVGEFLGISAGGVLDWLPVSASGSGDLLAANNLSELTPTASTARTNLGLGTGDSPTFKNLVISTGSITTSAPVTISQTWNDAAVAFTALKVNAISTASAASSLLLDLQVGGTSRFYVNKAGAVSAFNYNGLNGIGLGTMQIASSAASYGYHMARDYCVTWGGNTTLDGSIEVSLCRDAANTLALRNGINAQTFNVYGTYTSGSVYERMFARYNASDLAFEIGTQQAGATARPLILSANGSKRITLEVTGSEAINAYSYGNNSTNILALRTLNTVAKYQFYVNSSGKSELYVGTLGALISESGLSYFNGGNVGIGTTAPSSKLHVAETWNAAGTTFTAAKVDVTDTASAAASKLLDLQVGGVSKFSVGKTGIVSAASDFFGTYIYSGTAPTAGIFPNTVFAGSGGVIGFASAATFGGVVDTTFVRDGESDHIAMRRGALGQKFSVYGTYPGAAWERFTITAPTSGNVLLGTYKGTGGIARGLEFQTDGVSRWTISAAGNLIAATDNSYDIGLISSFRPKNIYASGGIVCSSLLVTSLGGNGFSTSGGGYIIFTAASKLRLAGPTDATGGSLLLDTADMIQVRNLANTAPGFIQGKLRTDTAYTGTTVVPTGFITLYDSTGTAYKVPCVAA